MVPSQPSQGGGTSGCGTATFAFLSLPGFNLSTGSSRLGSHSFASHTGSKPCRVANVTAGGFQTEGFVSTNFSLNGAHSVKFVWTVSWTINMSLKGAAGGFAELNPSAFIYRNSGLAPISETGGPTPVATTT